jgi:hypothetical protein
MAPRRGVAFDVLLLVILTVGDGDRAQQLPVRLAVAEVGHPARRPPCSRSAVAAPRVPSFFWRLRGGGGTGAKAERARKLRIRQERKPPPKMDKSELERQRDKILVVERVGGQYRRSYEERSAADRPQGAQAPQAADSTGRHTFSNVFFIEILYITHSLLVSSRGSSSPHVYYSKSLYNDLLRMLPRAASLLVCSCGS